MTVSQRSPGRDDPSLAEVSFNARITTTEEIKFHANTVSTHSAPAKVPANYMRNKCSSGLPFHLQHNVEFSAISLSFTNRRP